MKPKKGGNFQVYKITNIEEFAASLGRECAIECIKDISISLFKDEHKLSYVIEDDELVYSFLPIKLISKEVEKYVFSTTLHKNETFIKPLHVEIIIRDLADDLKDSILMKLSNHNILEMCWSNNDFVWRLKI